ncbi:MAG: hypothetical protein KKF12_10025, partial [Proteobacteria bacterium]|nr:hypothetical protein [Pseudomonadota bacterium]
RRDAHGFSWKGKSGAMASRPGKSAGLFELDPKEKPGEPFSVQGFLSVVPIVWGRMKKKE